DPRKSRPPDSTPAQPSRLLNIQRRLLNPVRRRLLKQPYRKKFTFVSGKSFARFPLAPVSVTGQPLDDSVPQMEVTVHDPAQAEIGYKVIRDDDGFAILFQPLVPGDYTVAVRLADRHIRDSPFTVPIGTDRQRELMDKLG